MKHTSQARSLSWFQDTYKAGRLVLKPPFQRKPVWSDKQRHALIESILLNIPIPEIYIQVTHVDEEQQYDVVDGQQRLRTILQFIGLEREDDQYDEDLNSFALDKLSKESPYYDITFADLKKPQRNNLYEFEICVRLLYTDERKDVEDVFKRLNKYTLPLKPQELRNATYHGGFAKLSEILADDDYWAVNRIISPAAIRRMGDIEMMSDLLIGLLHGPQGGAAKILDEYYETYEQFEDEIPGQPKLKRRFETTLAKVQELFPDIGDVPRWGNKADFYSLFVALGSFLESSKTTLDLPKLRKVLVNLATGVDEWLEDNEARVSAAARVYAAAIQKGSNDKARRLDRHEELVKLIAPHVQAA